MLNYISLFSCAGIGCFGFKEQGFNCIATNKFVSKGLEIQKYNNKCKLESGYICGDITLNETKNKIFDELNIRHSVGESVPTIIFSKIVNNIKKSLEDD